MAKPLVLSGAILSCNLVAALTTCSGSITCAGSCKSYAGPECAVNQPGETLTYGVGNGHRCFYYDASGWDLVSVQSAGSCVAHCDELGGTLPTVANGVDNQDLFDSFVKYHAKPMYLGYVKSRNVTWEWLSGCKSSGSFPYVNWELGEPDDMCGMNEKCAMMASNGFLGEKGEDGEYKAPNMITDTWFDVGCGVKPPTKMEAPLCVCEMGYRNAAFWEANKAAFMEVGEMSEECVTAIATVVFILMLPWIIGGCCCCCCCLGVIVFVIVLNRQQSQNKQGGVMQQPGQPGMGQPGMGQQPVVMGNVVQ